MLVPEIEAGLNNRAMPITQGTVPVGTLDPVPQNP
jgi:hypothetical protein